MALPDRPSAALMGRLRTEFTVRLDTFSEAAGLTTALQTRTAYSSEAWTTADSTTTPTAGMYLSSTGLTSGYLLEWRVVHIDIAGLIGDGTHGIVFYKAPKAGVAASGFFSEPNPTLWKPAQTIENPWRGS